MRTFEDKPATRERTPLLIGLVSPSGAGKTFSALRLATGIQRVAGGEIGVIDTEARRALHYADKFKFRHLPFGAPFSPADYLEAIEHFVGKGITNIIVDSASHEHEGTGGVLEMHQAELDRMAGANADRKTRDRYNMLAWAKPKAERRRLINRILQMPANFIFCFRAKEKIKPVKGEQPLDLGFQAISGDEWIYEMQLKCLLLPGSDGVPTWQSDKPGEALTIKLPLQFRPFFSGKQQLSEDIGEKLARWAAGDDALAPATKKEIRGNPNGDRVEKLIDAYSKCTTREQHTELEKERAELWKIVSDDVKARLKEASNTAPIGLPA